MDRLAARALLAMAAAALLSACASTAERAAEEPKAEPPVPSPLAAAPAPPAPEPAPAVAAAPAAEPPARGGVVLSAAARAASQPAATPRQLVGLARGDVQDLLGQPFLLKREGTGELWQYRAPNCVLDLFLYDTSAGGQRVAHAELRARRENARPPAGCYAQILHGPRPPQPQQTARG